MKHDWLRQAAAALWMSALHALAGTPNYDAFSDQDGHIRDEQVEAAQSMVRDPEQLEAVFSDAAKGNARAARVFEELENRFFPDIGREVAERTSSLACMAPVYRELSGECIPNWSALDFLRKESAAGARLRRAAANAYAARARQRGIENRAIVASVNALLAVTMAKGVVQQTPLNPSARAVVSEAKQVVTAIGIDDILRPGGRLIGAEGSSSQIRILKGGISDARKLFEQLTHEGVPIESTTYPGTLVRLSNGGTIGLRPVSTSGPPTLDVRIPGIGIREIKFVP
jgi:hypothetical protein